MTDHPTLEDLLRRVRAGDADSLARLFSHFRGRLETIVRFRLDSRLRSRVSEQDVLQDTYIAATERLAHFADKPDLPFFVWLRLLVNQRIVELHRQHLGAERRDIRREVSAEQRVPSPTNSMNLAALLVAQWTSPSQAAVRAERIARLERALEQMSDIDREVIVLRHFEELNSTETAAALGMERSAAGKRYTRALTRLRECLEEDPERD